MSVLQPVVVESLLWLSVSKLVLSLLTPGPSSIAYSLRVCLLVSSLVLQQLSIILVTPLQLAASFR